MEANAARPHSFVAATRVHFSEAAVEMGSEKSKWERGRGGRSQTTDGKALLRYETQQNVLQQELKRFEKTTSREMPLKATGSAHHADRITSHYVSLRMCISYHSVPTPYVQWLCVNLIKSYSFAPQSYPANVAL